MGRRQSFRLRLRRASDRAIESFASETYTTPTTDDTLQLHSYKPILQSFKGVSQTLKTNVNNALHVFAVASKHNETANKEISKAAADDSAFKEMKQSLRSTGIVTNFAAQQHLSEFFNSSKKYKTKNDCNDHANRRSFLVQTNDYLPSDLLKKEANGYKWKDQSLLQPSKYENLRVYIDAKGFE